MPKLVQPDQNPTLLTSIQAPEPNDKLESAFHQSMAKGLVNQGKFIEDQVYKRGDDLPKPDELTLKHSSYSLTMPSFQMQGNQEIILIDSYIPFLDLSPSASKTPLRLAKKHITFLENNQQLPSDAKLEIVTLPDDGLGITAYEFDNTLEPVTGHSVTESFFPGGIIGANRMASIKIKIRNNRSSSITVPWSIFVFDVAIEV